MLKKRLVGVITVKDGWAVQSFGYERYLPLGKPEVLAENLDRWGADEILVQCIDRSSRGLEPDFAVLERIAKQGLSTPTIFSGGVRTVEQGVRAISSGADRVCVDAVLHDTPESVEHLSDRLGAQAIIAVLPVSIDPDAAGAPLRWFDYRTRQHAPLSPAVLRLIAGKVVSEVAIVDWMHEGAGPFDVELLRRFPVADTPLIAFGGLGTAAQLRQVLGEPQVVAAMVGNFLNYREHAIREFKHQLGDLPLRVPAARPEAM
jgi:cyclase